MWRGTWFYLLAVKRWSISSMHLCFQFESFDSGFMDFVLWFSLVRISIYSRSNERGSCLLVLKFGLCTEKCTDGDISVELSPLYSMHCRCPFCQIWQTIPGTISRKWFILMKYGFNGNWQYFFFGVTTRLIKHLRLTQWLCAILLLLLK